MAESRKRKRQEDEETGCKEPANEGERQAGPAKQGIDRCIATYIVQCFAA